MNHLGSHFRGAFLTILFVSFTLVASAQTSDQSPAGPSPQAKRFRLIKAFVIDDRLSALRGEADIHSPVTQRLRLGRAVFIINTKNGSRDKMNSVVLPLHDAPEDGFTDQRWLCHLLLAKTLA